MPVLAKTAPPYFVEEKMNNLALGDLGVCAVCSALEAPQNLTLKQLCLAGNGLGDVGVKRLARALASPNLRLRRLSLCHNTISDTGAFALAGMLSANATLEELDLWGNCLSKEGKEAVLAAAKCDVFLEEPKRLQGLGINSRMRTILLDWVAEVHVSLATSAGLHLEADPQGMLFHTFSHIDSYLASRRVTRSELQLVAMACTLLAATVHQKSEHHAETSDGLISWLAFVTDGASTSEEVREAAEEIQGRLGSRLYQPTAYTFLRRYLRQTGWTEESFCLANYLIELTALDASLHDFRPQAVAAAAVVLSRQYASQGISVRQLPLWRAKLLLHAEVDVRLELAPCAAAMSRLHAALPSEASGCGGRFVRTKYESPKLHMVAKLRPNPPSDSHFFMGYLAADGASASGVEDDHYLVR